MLKHFAAVTLGLAVLFGATGSAFADKGGYVWTHKHLYLDTYPPTPTPTPTGPMQRAP
jgi:hypothetical protein